MIRGAVVDPTLTLDNKEIARRHITAYLLQRYHQSRLPAIRPEDQPHLFAVLGSVSDFRDVRKLLNREDLNVWLQENAEQLCGEVDAWLPVELSAIDRTSLLDEFVERTIADIDVAIEYEAVEGAPTPAPERPTQPPDEEDGAGTSLEAGDEEGQERPGRDPAAENLLDRLLYRGVLPRYAFPTDVASFHVFNVDRSSRYRPAFRYSPSQGLPTALSQYAPGKEEVWVDNKLWTSGAIYSPMSNDRYRAWLSRRFYYECSVCHYALTQELTAGSRRERLDCPACGTAETLGPATFWFRPPGFAHPVAVDEGTSPDDQPARSYATRAKLTAPAPADPEEWRYLNDRGALSPYAPTPYRYQPWSQARRLHLLHAVWVDRADFGTSRRCNDKAPKAFPR